MPSQALFFHAGCPVCVAAEQNVAHALDTARYNLEVIHLGETPERKAQAESLGIRSVPALVLEGQVFHINYGAALADLG